MADPRPSMFVGSSKEGYRIAQAIQVLLEHVCEVELWGQGTFGLSQGTLESLVLALDRFDFAVLVLTADDMTKKRGVKRPTARDNVVFELGLFVGGLGRDRTFMVFDRSNTPELPTDLAGITAATWAPHSSGNLESALGAACARIQNSVEKLGIRDAKRFRQLSEATANVEDAGSKVEDLIRLLARSRKVELDILSAQFGPLINSTNLKQIKQDIHDLEAMLKKHPNNQPPA